MTDRKKVIRGLEVCTDSRINCHECPYFKPVEMLLCSYPRMKDALATLREQEPSIVRCKDCRHYNTACCSYGCGWCENRNFGTHDEWYCADGEAGMYEADQID